MTMYTQSFTKWWLLSIKGAVLIVLGILAVIFPLKAILGFVFLIGLLLITGGISLIYSGLSHRSDYKYWLLWFLEGLVDLVFGFVILFSVKETTAVLFTFMGIWAISAGIVQIICTFMIPWRKFFWFLSGILSVIIGLLLVLNPFAGAVVASYFIAIHGIALGSLMLFISYEYKQIHDKHEEVHLLIN